MRTVLTALLLAAGVVGAHAQTCDDFKEKLDAALRTVKMDVDLTYRVSDDTPTVEYIEGLGDAKSAIGCRDGVLSQMSGTSYDADKRNFRKFNVAVLIATGVETAPRKAEGIANRIRAAAGKSESGSKWEEANGFTVEVTRFPGDGGEQFRVDPPSP